MQENSEITAPATSHKAPRRRYTAHIFPVVHTVPRQAVMWARTAFSWVIAGRWCPRLDKPSGPVDRLV